MSLTVVGSIAFDSVRTPFGERERMLGGSAVHFALAASFFTDVHVVGPVGDDFGDEHVELLRSRGVDVADIERVAGGRTFFWRGHYEADLNVAHTDDTQLGVFADFEPKLSEASKRADVLFLGNIQPDLQRQVRAQCVNTRLAALDSMNLWIETTRDSLVAAVGEVDCVMLNDAEVRMLTEEPNLARAARALMELGPRDRGRQARRVRRGAVHRRRLLRGAGLPARRRPRPDRCGRQLRRRLPRATSTCRGPSGRATRPCAARWPTAPCSPRSTSRSSAPSGWRG